MKNISLFDLALTCQHQLRRTLGRKRGVDHRFMANLAGLAGACVAIAFSANALADDQFAVQQLADLSIEELSNINVTSVSKHAEKLSDAPAAIYVITGDDIRRSGATTLPEALRLAPNLQVAEVANGQYAISARGFNNAIGNKLLVLIDGRTVYSALYSGVNWDSQFVMLEDIDRIEVISGPGGTLWGANAVNGVINIITRSADQTQGGLIAADDGNRQKGGSARYGGKIGDDGYYRLYATGFDSGNTTQANGRSATDDWQSGQVGFRTDWKHNADHFTVQGDAYQGKSDPDPTSPPTVAGNNVLMRWTRQLENDSSFNLQSYYDYTDNNDPFTFRDQEYTFDIEFQHAFVLFGNHKILWGGGYRHTRDDTTGYLPVTNLLPEAFIPADANLDWRNLFIQDEVALNQKLNLTMGVKAETNVYTGVEYLPSIRFAWKAAENQLWWGEVSRTVRAPARLDTDFYLYLHLPGYPLFHVIDGGPDFKSEIADVVEVGYRTQPTNSLSYSINGFYNFYDRLRSGQPPPGALIQNMMEGSTYGIEAWGNYQVTPDWRFSAGWMELRENLRLEAGSLDPTGPSALGDDPKFQFMLRSSLNVTDKQELDVAVRRIGQLPNPTVPAYTAADIRYGWKLRRNMEFSLAAQNLFAQNHVEFGTVPTRSEIATAVLMKLTWRY